MKKHFKIIAMILAFSFILSACGGQGGNSKEATTVHTNLVHMKLKLMDLVAR